MKRRNLLKAVGAAIIAPVTLITIARARKRFDRKFWSQAIVKDIGCVSRFSARGHQFWMFYIHYLPGVTTEQRFAFCSRFSKVRFRVIELLNEENDGVIHFECVPLTFQEHLERISSLGVYASLAVCPICDATIFKGVPFVCGDNLDV